MRTIIAGGRDFVPTNDDWSILDTLKDSIPITEVISGHAKGADSFGEAWADRNEIPLKIFLPDWDKYGKRAGFLRNIEMAKEADALVAFPGGRGTAMMLKIAQEYGLKIEVIQ